MTGLSFSATYAFFCFFAALFSRFGNYGIGQLTLSVLSAALTTYTLGLFSLSSLDKTLAKRSEWLALVMALLGSLDLLWILAKQGVVENGIPYFRPPLHHDLERHLILINALLRKTGSPFFPNAPIAYQTLWHQGVATLVGPWFQFLEYSQFKVFVWGTGFLFFWGCLSSIGQFKPRLLNQVYPAFCLGFLLFLHTDLFSLLSSWFVNGGPGIEADWSFRGPLIFRMNSPKMIALSSPQNALFGIVLCIHWIAQDRKVLEVISAALLFICSPALAVMYLIPHSMSLFIKEKRIPYYLISLIILVPILFQLAYGYSLTAYFERPAIFSLQWFPSWIGHWLFLPFILVGLLGVPGLLLSFFGGRGILSKDFIFGGIVFLLIPVLGYNVITDIELRRHISILTSLLILLVVAEHWEYFEERLSQRLSNLTKGMVVGMGLVLHGYFIYSYLAKPTIVSAESHWNEYREMRDAVRERYKNLKVLSAVDPDGWGISFSPVLETTTSFAGPLDASVHSLLSQKQKRQLTSIAMGKNIATVAEQVGYDAILWGPIEEKMWGERIRLELSKTWRLLERTQGEGSRVSLYQLRPEDRMPISQPKLN